MATVSKTVTIRWNTYETVSATRSVIWNVQAADSGVSDFYDSGRCGPFALVTVDYLVEGITRVYWFLRPGFVVKPPLTFQLQVGSTANLLADDWTDVGPPLQNVYEARDSVRRAFGKQLTVHYRIKAIDGDNNVYISQPASALGNLGTRDFAIAREIVRKWRLTTRNFGGTRGFLLKKRRDGQLCPRCLEEDTGESLEVNCPICFGTRFVGGYYRPIDDTYVMFGPDQIFEERNEQPHGWDMPSERVGVILANPLLSTGDVWVDAQSDLRYYIQKIQVKVHLRNVPIVSEATFRQLPFNSAVYKIPVGA